MRLLLVLVLLTGCSTIRDITNRKSINQYDKRMAAYVGQNISEVISVKGIPTKTMTVGETKFYEWDKSWSGSRSTEYNRWTDSLDTTENKFYCKTTFTTDLQDIVLTWKYYGNRCN